jgi:pyridoxal phosphate enzyme (YggS family)
MADVCGAGARRRKGLEEEQLWAASLRDMSVAENLAVVREGISTACRLAGRPEGDVTLMAVSKVHPAERFLEAYAAGQRLFGENRVQEFQAKSVELRSILTGPDKARVHLIGPLQNNKTSKAAELFDAVDTIDSLKTAQRLASAARALGRVVPILVEVKLSDEEAKHGVAPEELADLLGALEEVEQVSVRGLMTVPPWSEDPEVARPYFRRLRELRDQMQGRHADLTELSMGMSNDFAVAIHEGSTCVRIGTAIFGRRNLTVF